MSAVRASEGGVLVSASYDACVGLFSFSVFFLNYENTKGKNTTRFHLLLSDIRNKYISGTYVQVWDKP